MKSKLLVALATSVAIVTPAFAQEQQRSVTATVYPAGKSPYSSSRLAEQRKQKQLNLGLGLVALGAALAVSFDQDGSTPPPADPKNPHPTPPGDGESMWMFDRSYLDADRIIAAINKSANDYRAAEHDIETVKKQTDVQHNYAMRNSNMYNKIALGLTGKGIDVAVVDSGVDFDNVNLDDVKRGDVIRFLHGGSFTDAEDGGLRHGTAVAQVIAGDVGDDPHARGIAPGVTLHDITYLRDRADKTSYVTGNVRQYMFDAIANGKYDIANMSFSIASSDAVKNLAYAADKFLNGQARASLKHAFDNGTILVVSTGNRSLHTPDNLFSGIGVFEDLTKGQFMTVAALDVTGTDLADYSNACGQAMSFCISATGNFYPVMRTGGFGSFSGTSSSAPVVTASLALLKEQFPELTPGELVELVFATADDLGDKGIDEKFGRGALNLDRAMVPVGELRFITGDSVSDEALALSEVGFTSNVVTSSIKSAFSNQNVTLIDDFNRGFNISADELIIEVDDRKQPISEFETRMRFSDGSEAIFAAGEGGAYLADKGLSLGVIRPDALVANGELFDRGYHALSIMDRSYMLGYGFGGYDISLAKSDENDTFAAWAERGFGDVDLSLGLIKENGTLLGSQIGTGETDSAFISATWNGALSDSLNMFASGTAMNSQYTGGAGLIETADIFSASAQIGASLDNTLGRTTIALGTPLASTAGSLGVNIPVGRVAATDNQVSQAVIRDYSTRDIKREAPLDLGFSHEFDLGNGVIKVSAMTEIGGDAWGHQDAYVGIGYSLKF